MEALEKYKMGFTYTVELLDGDVLVAKETVDNVLPYEGLDYIERTSLLGGPQISQWYLGLFGNNYNPTPQDKALSFAQQAGEVSAYENDTRHQVTFNQPDMGMITNTGNEVEVVFTAEVSVTGGFLISSPGKGSSIGVLLSAVRFNSPKQAEPGNVLRVTTGLQLTPA